MTYKLSFVIASLNARLHVLIKLTSLSDFSLFLIFGICYNRL